MPYHFVSGALVLKRVDAVAIGADVQSLADHRTRRDLVAAGDREARRPAVLAGRAVERRKLTVRAL